eukprot:scaffold30826_cov67-Phaeocystis_antarctica.AAC.7
MRQLGAAGPDRPRQQSLACWRSVNPLSRRAEWIDHATARPTGECCLAVWSRWLESITRLGGFRALKKTPEAPYTATLPVNYRDHASRGTTRVPCRLAPVPGLRSRGDGQLRCTLPPSPSFTERRSQLGAPQGEENLGTGIIADQENQPRSRGTEK